MDKQMDSWIDAKTDEERWTAKKMGGWKYGVVCLDREMG